MSEALPPVDLVFLWHHHQPDYRSPRDGCAWLPWVRLHASKDYLDMARRLERHPRLRATFNFVPSLLDQLETATAGGADRLFDLLARDVGSLDGEERREVMLRCTMSPRYAQESWPAYRKLCDRANRARGANGVGDPFGDNDLTALETWFLLAWVDPMFHDAAEAVAVLKAAPALHAEHRDGLLALHRRLVSEVIPAYRTLAERGQIELSESPYYHPILPLLVQHTAALRARPDLVLPNEPFAAAEDAAAQIERALVRHERAFGARPAGMWPPEGSVSPEAAELMARAGIRWAATDEGILWGSLPSGAQRRDALYKTWQVETAAGPLALFFRDRELSDRIGFVYHHWRTEEAVADFLIRLRRIAREHTGPEPPVVSVILDGENCWEHYPNDGGPFLDALYGALDDAPDIRTRMPSQVLAERTQMPRLDELHSGSWINADFRIWIGHTEKNRAWDLVARARRALVEAGIRPETHPKAWEALYAAEGSDWFWWLGEDHYTQDKALFDRLFREHLSGVYERASLPPPGWLQVPVAPLALRRATRHAPLELLSPVLDGRRSNFYEWHGAGHHRLGAGGGSMHRDRGLGADLYFGFDLERFFLRLDFGKEVLPRPDLELWVDVLAPRARRFKIASLARGEHAVIRGDAGHDGEPVPGALCRIESIFEIAIPFASMEVGPGQSVEILAHMLDHGQIIETLPGDDLVRFVVPDASFESSMWSA